MRSEQDVRAAFDALLVGIDGFTQSNIQVIVDLAARHRLPALYNVRTSNALGLDVPPTLLARADEVIE